MPASRLWRDRERLSKFSQAECAAAASARKPGQAVRGCQQLQAGWHVSNPLMDLLAGVLRSPRRVQAHCPAAALLLPRQLADDGMGGVGFVLQHKHKLQGAACEGGCSSWVVGVGVGELQLCMRLA